MIYDYFTNWIAGKCRECRNKKHCEEMEVFCSEGLFAFLDGNGEFDIKKQAPNLTRYFDYLIEEEKETGGY